MVKKTLRLPLPVYEALTREADEAKVKLARWIQEHLREARPDLPWD